MTICNQFLVNDAVRDKKYMATVRCNCCSEESSLPGKFPVKIEEFTGFLSSFVAHHDQKGCNKILIRQKC